MGKDTAVRIERQRDLVIRTGDELGGIGNGRGYPGGPWEFGEVTGWHGVKWHHAELVVRDGLIVNESRNITSSF